MLFTRIDSSAPEGGFHDLAAMAEEVYRMYFSASTRVTIQWGKRSPQRKRRSIRLGSYDHASKVIRIHPSLDTALVPRFFIQSIIYHEYLHHVLGPPHNARFHKHERRFHLHREAKQWLKRNLPLLLGRHKEAKRTMPPAAPREVARPAQMQLF